MKSVCTSAILTAAGVAGLGTSAYAGGFLADTFVKPFDPGLAKKLDEEHAKAGNPLDHAANAAAGTAVGTVAGPAAGAATTGALEARDAARRNH